MFKFSQALVKNTRSSVTLHNAIRFNNFATATTVELKNLPVDNADENNLSKNTDSINNAALRSRNHMVAAAFASLQSVNSSEIKTPFTDNRVLTASTIDELLSISEGTGVSRKHALKVVSVLADWSLKGKVNLPEFESDPRFIKLCKVLTKGASPLRNTRNPINRNDDLSTILSVTADDEAAKLVASITLHQMVKVMTSLAHKKRRSIMLLRALSFNITKNTGSLDLKQCGDLLYSMSVLNFPDENLLERICTDVCKCLDDSIKKSSVIGSILTSLGLLKYKNTGVLDALCSWITKFQTLCRPQDIFALFLTLAVLNYEPPNADKLYEVLMPQVTIADAAKPTVWLDLVWSLILLNRAKPDQISTVLSEEFVGKIEKEYSTSLSSKLKLLNIDSAVENFISTYTGPRLSASFSFRNEELIRSREKEEMSLVLVDTLKNLISETHVRSKVNTGMGFYIDAECVLDKKLNPIPVDKYSGASDQVRIAIVAYDYHDMCKGSVEPTGINALTSKLLEARGYKVLVIPYTEFKLKDKVVHRVQYIESKLKTLIQL